MRSRAQSSEHAETVNRRLRLLSAELNGIRPSADGTDVDEPHTHLRELRPLAPDEREDLDLAERATAVPGPVARRSFASDLSEQESRAIRDAAGVDVGGALGGMPPRVPRPGRHAARRGTASWVDLSAFRGRVSLTPASLAVLAVVIAVGLGVTAWWVIRDDPGVPVAAPGTGASAGPSLATPVASAGASEAQDGSSAGEVIVDVAGKVRRPGIVVLEPGSRVIDAIKAAGGARRGADLTGLNRARPVQDGEQIVVGVPAPPGVAASAAPSSGGSATGELVSLNTATTTELETLPGVGPVTAAAIVDWRETNGGFASVDQLLEVDGIGEKTLAQLAPHVTL